LRRWGHGAAGGDGVLPSHPSPILCLPSPVVPEKPGGFGRASPGVPVVPPDFKTTSAGMAALQQSLSAPHRPCRSLVSGTLVVYLIEGSWSFLNDRACRPRIVAYTPWPLTTQWAHLARPAARVVCRPPFIVVSNAILFGVSRHLSPRRLLQKKKKMPGPWRAQKKEKIPPPPWQALSIIAFNQTCIRGVVFCWRRALSFRYVDWAGDVLFPRSAACLLLITFRGHTVTLVGPGFNTPWPWVIGLLGSAEQWQARGADDDKRRENPAAGLGPIIDAALGPRAWTQLGCGGGVGRKNGRRRLRHGRHHGTAALICPRRPAQDLAKPATSPATPRPRSMVGGQKQGGGRKSVLLKVCGMPTRRPAIA